MRICIVYDCIYPHTVGGAERWYRNLAERLAAEGHEVDYLTLRQWPEGEDAGVPGVRVIAVGPRMAAVRGRTAAGSAPPLRFGLGVLAPPRPPRREATTSCTRRRFRTSRSWPPARSARCAATGSSSTGTRSGRRRTGASTSAALPARSAGCVQRLCLRIPQRAFCFSRLHERRLREQGLRGELTVLRGPVRGVARPARRGTRAADGRLRGPPHPGEARAGARARDRRGARRGSPTSAARSSATARSATRCCAASPRPGSTASSTSRASWRPSGSSRRVASALCLVLPSRREGYGLVVVEAAAAGTPSVVVADADNAATELVEHGVNGMVAVSAAADDLADGNRPRLPGRRRAPCLHGGVVREARAGAGAGDLARGRARRLPLSGAPYDCRLNRLRHGLGRPRIHVLLHALRPVRGPELARRDASERCGDRVDVVGGDGDAGVRLSNDHVVGQSQLDSQRCQDGEREGERLGECVGRDVGRAEQARNRNRRGGSGEAITTWLAATMAAPRRQAAAWSLRRVPSPVSRMRVGCWPGSSPLHCLGRARSDSFDRRRHSHQK